MTETRLLTVTLMDNGKGTLRVLSATSARIGAYGTPGEDEPMKDINAARLLNNSNYAVGKNWLIPNNQRKHLGPK